MCRDDNGVSREIQWRKKFFLTESGRSYIRNATCIVLRILGALLVLSSRHGRKTVVLHRIVVESARMTLSITAEGFLKNVP